MKNIAKLFLMLAFSGLVLTGLTACTNEGPTGGAGPVEQEEGTSPVEQEEDAGPVESEQ